jgi:hypothetical protein
MFAACQSSSASLRLQPAHSSGKSARAYAIELIEETIDPQTGHVDVRTIATWVAGAGVIDFAVAAQAYSAIEEQLLCRSPADVARFNQDIVEAARRLPAPGGLRGALGVEKRLTRKQNPVLAKPWEATPGKRTGPPAFTAGLQTLLESHGIRVAPARTVIAQRAQS